MKDADREELLTCFPLTGDSFPKMFGMILDFTDEPIIDLVEDFRSDNNRNVRWFLGWVLERVWWRAKSESEIALAVRSLCDAMRHDPDLHVQTKALNALGEMGPLACDVLPQLIDILHSSNNTAIQAEAVAAIAEIGSLDTVLPEILQALNHEEEAIKTRAALALIQRNVWNDDVGNEIQTVLKNFPQLKPRVVSFGDSTPADVARCYLEVFLDVELRKQPQHISKLPKEAVPQVIKMKDVLRVREIDSRSIVDAALYDLANNKGKLWTSDVREYIAQFLLGLFWNDEIYHLQDLEFYQKVQRSQLKKLSLPPTEEYMEDAWQQFALQMLEPSSKQVLDQPGQYPKLPGVVRILAHKAARSLRAGIADSRGKVRIQTSCSNDFSNSEWSPSQCSTLPSPVDELVLRDERQHIWQLALNLRDYVSSELEGFQRQLAIEVLFKKTTIRQLEPIFDRKWEGLRRHVDTVQRHLLMKLGLPSISSLHDLVELLPQHELVGVLPVVESINEG